MTVRAPLAIAVADFRERVRRPAYAVVLATAVGLGYLAVPAVDGHWVILNAGEYRGRYDSAYVGTVTALAGALWLTIAGFYVIRGAIVRDERTGVGQLLAATPLRGSGYLAGKFLSNLLVLASMLGVLAVTALVMQLARGEVRAVDPYALLLPFGLLAFPVLAVTAAVAVLFETVRPLRAGLGNVVWFFGAMVAGIVGQGAAAPLGGLGVYQVARSMRAEAVEQGHPGGGEFGLGLMYLDRPPRTFDWSGLDPEAGFVAQRLLLILLAVGVAVLPALWFGRFDPARTSRRPSSAPLSPMSAGALPVSPMSAGAVPLSPAPPCSTAGPARLVGLRAAPSWLTASRVRTTGQPAVAGRTAVDHSGRRAAHGFGRLLGGELRVLRRSGSRWWWLGAAVFAAVGAVVPGPAVATVVLPVAWIWPVLLWSRLGTQRHEYGVQTLLGAYPGVRRRMLAEWAAGLTLAGLTGLVPMLRMLSAQDGAGLAAWLAGVFFIPSLALASGVLSRTHRLFQAGYLALWFTVINGIAATDFMGAVRVDGRPVGPAPLLVGGAALALLGGAFLLDALRQSRR